MDIFEKYPELAATLDRLSNTRFFDILQGLVESDAEYGALRKARADASAALMNAVPDSDAIEAYADAVYAQECYELEHVYRRGFADALEILEKTGILSVDS